MKRKFIATGIIAVFIAFSWAYLSLYSSYNELRSKSAANAQIAQKLVNPPSRTELLKLVNGERAKVGAKPLTEDTRLDVSAQRKADDEVKYSYFGHISPHDKRHGYEFIDGVGIECKTDSENLIGASTAHEAINWWDNSKPHYAAMVNPIYATTGFGVAYVKDIPLKNITSSTPVDTDLKNSYVIVEHFCQP